MTVTNNRGSLWRIWDLHVHSPASYGEDYTSFITNVSSSKADVIGINDYCTLKGYEKIISLGGIPNKTIFPVVELRMNNLLITRKDSNGVKINFHIIFNNDKEVFQKISTWLSSLECYDENGKKTQLGTISSNYDKLTFDFENTLQSLKDYNLYNSHALIWLPYDEYGGIDEINPHTDSYFKMALIHKTHIIGSSSKKQIEFFKWEDKKHTEDQYRQWLNIKKPCIKGSDAHEVDYPFGCLRDSNSRPINKYCWIKANPTFNGLKQILVEPDRVFIGDEPSLLKREREHKTKFIDSLKIEKIQDSNIADIWFNNTEINFNSGLVAIIGNKGSGKSAITDIIGLCGNTDKDPKDFSFLTDTKFRKNKLSANFEATLKWKDNSLETKTLNNNPDIYYPERVQYLPQNFLEKLCADVEKNQFEEEIKKIIYSHIPEEDKLGQSSLDNLIEYKTKIIDGEIRKIQDKISELNIEIINLESYASESYVQKLENNLKLKQKEMKAHDIIKPIKPEVTETDSSSNSEIIILREKLADLDTQIEKLHDKQNNFSIKLENLRQAQEYYQSLSKDLEWYKDKNNEIVQTLESNNIDINAILNYTINTTAIEQKIEELNKEKEEISKLLDATNTSSSVYQKNILEQSLKEKQEVLDKPAKDYQKYCDDLTDWEKQKKTIEGDENIEGSLKFYENRLAYIKKDLPRELSTKYDVRKNLIINLYEEKIKLIHIRKELFKSVTTFINNIDFQDNYEVKLDVSFTIDSSFTDDFLAYINKSKIGSFYGDLNDSKEVLKNLILRVDLTSNQGFIDFSQGLLNRLQHNYQKNEEKIDVKSQLAKGKQVEDLYNFICFFDYFKPIYSLKLGDKNLQELSPGERGALLLIFYLVLDKDDIPLIIDQPEDNLDNESVYNILVHFIKQAKERRQIIMVTHNPNLAVVCDADQIIHMSIDKKNHNKVNVYSDAIEDNEMNGRIITILEGTMPAFNNRDSKYIRN